MRLRHWALRWGPVTQNMFDDEPNGPNLVAWTRFEMWLTRRGVRRVTLWRGPTHWA